jgi:ribosomal protein L11 methyltransferase
MAWVSLSLDVKKSAAEAAQELLTDCGAAGLELRDGEGGMPNVRTPNPGEAIVIGFFEKRSAATAALKKAKATLKPRQAELETVVEKDWSEEWKRLIRPVTVGRLWVGPPWEKAPKGKVCLFIEPKMAFGTGDHPTTSLCLAAVDDFLGSHPGASVLDVGTGTGVLAFAAKKLGAGRVIGTDNDPIAVELAKECAAENAIEGIELSGKPLESIKGRFDLVLANILANTLIALAPKLVEKVKERLVLAGVLVHQADEVTAAFVTEGMKPVGRTIQGEWIRLDFERP